MSMRVAIIVARADVALGGAERSVFEVARALTEAGCEVDVLAAQGSGQASNVHLLCSDLSGKRVSLGAFERALRDHLAQNAYDIIHSVLPFDFADVYQPRGGTYAETAARNAASYRSLWRRWYKRATALANLRRARLLRCERRLCQKPDGPAIAALSGYVVEQFEKHYGTDRRRITVILNGVNTDKQADPQQAERLRSQVFQQLTLGETADPVLLLFAAHNPRLKGLDSLIRALRLVQKTSERPPCLVVLGVGKSDPYRRLAQRLGIEPHVAFLGRTEQVQDVLAFTDVGILPTFYDPSSRFILEALAAGKPVITTRFNGAIDHFTDGRHGRVVDSPDNIAALADAITYFADRTHIEEASQAIVSDELDATISVHRVARELLDLYQSILACKPHA